MASTDAAAGVAEDKPKKKSKLPLILGLVLALVLGAGGFLAVKMGLIFGSGEPSAAGHGEAAAEGHGGEAAGEVTPLPDVAFVALDPLIVNIDNASASRHLRFQAQLEVEAAHAEEVRAIMPRLVDALNSYLRAVDVRDLEDRSAIVRLRAQMLRRMQLIAGSGRIRDLLIMEFVLN